MGNTARKLQPLLPPIVVVERKVGTPANGVQFVGDVADLIDRLMRVKK